METDFLNFHDEQRFSDFPLSLNYEQNLLEESKSSLAHLIDSDYEYVDQFKSESSDNDYLQIEQEQELNGDIALLPISGVATTIPKLDNIKEDYAKVLTDWQEHIGYLQATEIEEDIDFNSLGLHAEKNSELPLDFLETEKKFNIKTESESVIKTEPCEFGESDSKDDIDVVGLDSFDFPLGSSEFENGESALSDENSSRESVNYGINIKQECSESSSTGKIELVTNQDDEIRRKTKSKKNNPNIHDITQACQSTSRKKDKNKKKKKMKQESETTEHKKNVAESNDSREPVLEASDVKTLFEIFEASEFEESQNIPAVSNLADVLNAPAAPAASAIPAKLTNANTTKRKTTEVKNKSKIDPKSRKAPPKKTVPETTSTSLLKINQEYDGTVQMDHDYCNQSKAANVPEKGKVLPNSTKVTKTCLLENKHENSDNLLKEKADVVHYEKKETICAEPENTKKILENSNSQIPGTEMKIRSILATNILQSKKGTMYKNQPMVSVLKKPPVSTHPQSILKTYKENICSPTKSDDNEPQNENFKEENSNQSDSSEEKKPPKKKLNLAEYRSRREQTGSDGSIIQPMVLIYIHHKSTTTEPICTDPDNPIWSEMEIVSAIRPKAEIELEKSRPKPVTKEAGVQTHETVFNYTTEHIVESESALENIPPKNNENEVSDNTKDDEVIECVDTLNVNENNSNSLLNGESVNNSNNDDDDVFITCDKKVDKVVVPVDKSQDKIIDKSGITSSTSIKSKDSQNYRNKRRSNQSRSRSRSKSYSNSRSRVKTTSPTIRKNRNRSRNRNGSRNRSRSRNGSKNRSRSRNGSRNRSLNRDKRKSRYRSKSRGRYRNKSTSYSRSPHSSRSRSRRRNSPPHRGRTSRRRRRSYRRYSTSSSSSSLRSRSSSRSSYRYKSSRSSHSRSYRSKSRSRSRSSRYSNYSRSYSRSPSGKRRWSRSSKKNKGSYSRSSSRRRHYSSEEGYGYCESYRSIPIRNFNGYYDKEKQRQVEERRVVYVGRLKDGVTKSELRRRFEVFGPVVDISIHFRERGDNYGFVTFSYKNDAYKAVEHGNDDPSLPRYDLCFGGRRAFCKTEYADLDNNGCSSLSNPLKRNLYEVQGENTFDLLLKEAQEKLKKRKA